MPSTNTTRAAALIGAARLALEQGAAEEADGLATEAVALARAQGESRLLGAAVYTRGLAARARGNSGNSGVTPAAVDDGHRIGAQVRAVLSPDAHLAQQPRPA